MKNPLDVFHEWLDDAARRGVHEPSAMALATIGPDGKPSVRMVLLKEATERGFVFYTNLESPKACALRANPHAALCFYWNPPGRQVRVDGIVETIDETEADAYFASRPYLSRIGAWASRQSQPLKTTAELERAVAATMVKYPRGRVPRPPHWSGFRLVPESIELWTEKPFRMHDRTRYERKPGGKGWNAIALYP
ncbi:pyridoxamine 5'-phosphate oxidase [Opitutaceae bacterium TAV4]|uniref:pyridoxamine 5'-phosphate oxidase n=1 Tax=Geminisphaera colitermitum TaxID=1148786 RepID=UPI0009DCEF9E|nr:pyridoxamine 5'-phosphate oxidase [Geminisphaera colitermitum]RRJ95791.1 pyridoxamine 5'-phosphate oxidase [Opitutaceae bacterium TAV4]RRJ99211.1 pyridoxamine 5'-phosphate oxidase [Opitutaceae bacterium TAV3]